MTHQLPAAIPDMDIPDARLRVLLVDDDPILNTISAELVGGKHAVTATTDPRQALELWQSHEFDVLVTDMEMPGMTGLELARSCRATRPDTTVIMITGAEVPANARDGVVDRFLRKPSGFTLLLGALADIEAR